MAAGDVTGIGGVFVRARDPEALRAWYIEHLGAPDQDGTVVFRAGSAGTTQVLGFFDADSDYFPLDQPAMVNLRVDDLEATAARLRTAGAEVDERRQEQEGIGRFAWFADPEGNRVELWEPAPGL